MKSYRHQVKITIEGFKLDRILNKAIDKKIPIKRLVYLSETKVECYVNDCDLGILKELSSPLYRVAVKDNIGLAYSFKRMWRQPVFLCAIMLTTAMVIAQSFFVKTIEISGYKGIPESELRSCLAEAGIEEGSFIPKIEWQEAEHHIYDVFPQVSWLQLVYDGRKVFLKISEGEITENLENPWVEKPKYYCNIVAEQAGYIESINNYRGVALAEAGDYVEKGQILILGCVPIKEKYHVENAATEYFVRAKGEIWAKVPYRVNFTQNLYDENDQVRGKKAIIDKAEQQIRQWTKEKLPESAEILNKDLNFSYKENIIEIGVTIEIRQQIGVEQEILIGQKNSDSSGN